MCVCVCVHTHLNLGIDLALKAYQCTELKCIRNTEKVA